MKKFTAIVVGAGSRGTSYSKHMRNLADKYNIVGVAEPIDTRRNNVKNMFDIPDENCYTDYKDILAKPKFADIAIISTQDSMHVPPALMAIEKGETETVATKCFFMGIFHDVPEAFTRDIPSPIKDKIPGFRKLTEEYELLTMEKYVYPYLSEESANALKTVMFEDAENAQYKKLMKGADYMSAVSEIWRQLKAGSRDDSIVVSMNKHQKKFESGRAEYTEGAKELLEWMLKFANGLNLCSDEEIFD